MKKKILNIVLILLINIIFIDIVGAETYNNYDSLNAPVSCGGELIKNIPAIAPRIVSIIYNIIQVVVPVLLVIFGSIDLAKGITVGKEDEMKKGQQIFIKRIISGILVFMVFIAVKFLVSVVASDDQDAGRPARIMQCAECFIKNSCNN